MSVSPASFLCARKPRPAFRDLRASILNERRKTALRALGRRRRVVRDVHRISRPAMSAAVALFGRPMAARHHLDLRRCNHRGER
jgi:hypothetical protein